VDAREEDIVLTERVTGIPVAVLSTPYIQRVGLRAGPIARWLLRQPRTKHFMRGLYAMRGMRQLSRASLDPDGAFQFWQAGKSVRGIHGIEPAGDIVRRFTAAAERELGAR
jgi:nitronate monooxygenase